MEPTIVERVEQPYVGRRESITMTGFARVADHQLEMLMTNPAEEPDRHKWETVLLFKLAG